MRPLKRQTVNSQAKGAAGELEVVSLLRAYGWGAAHRIRVRTVTYQASDIGGGPRDALIEVKRKRLIDLSTSLDHLPMHRPQLPLLVHRSDGFNWLATMPKARFREFAAILNGPFWLHRGITRAIGLNRTFETVRDDCPDGLVPVLEHGATSGRFPPLVTLDFLDLLPLLQAREGLA